MVLAPSWAVFWRYGRFAWVFYSKILLQGARRIFQKSRFVELSLWRWLFVCIRHWKRVLDTNNSLSWHYKLIDPVGRNGCLLVFVERVELRVFWNSFSCNDFLCCHPLYVCCLSWVALYVLHVLGSSSFNALLFFFYRQREK